MSRLEDSLDICNYRQPQWNLGDEIKIQNPETLPCHDVIKEFSIEKDYFHSGHNLSLNTSKIYFNELLLNTDSAVKMEDTLSICSYRRDLSQPVTPIRCNSFVAKYLNKCVIPSTLFANSPIHKTNPPIGSSPVIHE